MRRSEGPLEDVQGMPIEGAGLRGAAEAGEERGQVVEGQSPVRMPETQDLLLDLQGPQIEPLGRGRLAARLMDRREVVEVDGDLVVFRAVDAREDGERLTIESLG